MRELRSRCGAGGILPTSYTFLPHLLNAGSEPFASGTYGDVYEGTLDGSRICIKHIRVYTQYGSQKAAKVRRQRRCFPCSLPLTKGTGLLPRGHNVETLDAPKHPIPTGCHYHSQVPARFELDAWRRPPGIHPEESQCRSTQARRCSSYFDHPLLTLIVSYRTSLMASSTSTPAMWFMETSREYVVVLTLFHHRINTCPAEHPRGRLRQRAYCGLWLRNCHS